MLAPVVALTYSFLFGMLHGILPDEHTWPIVFSYAIGGASGREGMKAGLYFSAAFTFQRALLAELAYLALAPFLLSPTVNGVVYTAVGVVMSVAGWLVLSGKQYPHLHLFAHHHEEATAMETTTDILGRRHVEGGAGVPPVRWAIVHGFIAGFGLGAFSLFVNTAAVSAMPSPWLGFLPGLLFGLGTMLTLAVVGALLGMSLRWLGSLSEQEVRQIGARTGGRTLLFGGLLFGLLGVVTLLGIANRSPVDLGNLMIVLLLLGVAAPALIYSWREVVAKRLRR